MEVIITALSKVFIALVAEILEIKNASHITKIVLFL